MAKNRLGEAERVLPLNKKGEEREKEVVMGHYQRALLNWSILQSVRETDRQTETE